MLVRAPKNSHVIAARYIAYQDAVDKELFFNILDRVRYKNEFINMIRWNCRDYQNKFKNEPSIQLLLRFQ